MRFARFLSLLTALLLAAPVCAKMTNTPVTWTLNDTHFQGMLIYDDASAATRPGLVMVPNWTGINELAIAKAGRIAGRDYVILLADMYGEHIRPKNTDEALAAVKPLYADRALMRARIGAAFDQLKAQAAHAPIDPSRLAAIGFCFGGSAVLDLARSGSDVKAVISFHGGLSTDDPSLAKHIQARVLAINGADDTSTMPDVPKFTAEMRQNPADWEFVEIGHAVHCFTETEATATTGNCRYDAKAAARSYQMMQSWLAESFGTPAARSASAR